MLGLPTAVLLMPTPSRALRRALDVQIRIFGEDDAVTNALFLDMAMVVANLGRFDESDGLLRRAAPIIERSPSPAERARLATYRASISALRGDYVAARSEASDAVAQWRAITDARPVTDDTALARGEMAMALNLEAFVLMRSGDTTSAQCACKPGVTGAGGRACNAGLVARGYNG
jgi:hypothetical protein